MEYEHKNCHARYAEESLLKKVPRIGSPFSIPQFTLINHNLYQSITDCDVFIF